MRSAPCTAHAATSRTTSSACASGSGTSSTWRTSGPPGSVMTTARMPRPYRVWDPRRAVPRCGDTAPAGSTVTRMERIAVGIGPLTESEVVAVARHGAGVDLTAQALDAIAASRVVVDSLAHDVE